nr:TetR/AcrR family transcriptional regulator [Rhizobium sp. Q54]
MRTRDKILTCSEDLLRRRGYSDFSYADVVKHVGIGKASIHHHFPTKEDLGVEVVAEYLERFQSTLMDVLVKHDKADSRLSAYAGIFEGILADRSFPLCTALAAELGALPPRIRTQTVRFFNIHLEWLEKVVAEGIARGELPSAPEDAKAAARILLASIEGGAVVGWALADPLAVRVAFDEIISCWKT